MKLYQTIDSASIKITENLELEVDSQYFLLNDLENGQYRGSSEIELEKIIELRDFLNNLLAEVE